MIRGQWTSTKSGLIFVDAAASPTATASVWSDCATEITVRNEPPAVGSVRIVVETLPCELDIILDITAASRPSLRVSWVSLPSRRPFDSNHFLTRVDI